MAARLSIIDAAATPPRVAATSQEPMFDEARAIDATDVDGDGKPELLVHFLARRSEVLWVYSVSADGVPRLISPSTKDDGPLTEPIILDIDGTGRLAIIDTKLATSVDADEEKTVTPQYTLFTMQDGVFRPAAGRRIFFAEAFARGKGQPATDTRDVHVPEAGAYRLIVLNGHVDGTNRCSSGTIGIGQTTLFDERDFKQNRYATTNEVQLPADSLVHVELKSAPDCRIFVLIDRVSH